MEAAVITPLANPVSARWMPGRRLRFMKNMHALPADVPINGIINPQKTVVDMGCFFPSSLFDRHDRNPRFAGMMPGGSAAESRALKEVLVLQHGFAAIRLHVVANEHKQIGIQAASVGSSDNCC